MSSGSHKVPEHRHITDTEHYDNLQEVALLSDMLRNLNVEHYGNRDFDLEEDVPLRPATFVAKNPPKPMSPPASRLRGSLSGVTKLSAYYGQDTFPPLRIHQMPIVNAPPARLPPPPQVPSQQNRREVQHTNNTPVERSTNKEIEQTSIPGPDHSTRYPPPPQEILDPEARPAKRRKVDGIFTPESELPNARAETSIPDETESNEANMVPETEQPQSRPCEKRVREGAEGDEMMPKPKRPKTD